MVEALAQYAQPADGLKHLVELAHLVGAKQARRAVAGITAQLDAAFEQIAVGGRAAVGRAGQDEVNRLPGLVEVTTGGTQARNEGGCLARPFEELLCGSGVHRPQLQVDAHDAAPGGVSDGCYPEFSTHPAAEMTGDS